MAVLFRAGSAQWSVPKWGALHRLANHIERELSELTRTLLADSRPNEAKDIVYNGCSFIESLREARDSEGGDE